MTRGLFVLTMLLMAGSSGLRAHEWHSSEQMARAARALLDTLGPEQREVAQFAFEAEERTRWSNLPILMVPPSGLLLKDMNDAQRAATQALLRASLSSQGYAKFVGVMRLEVLLHEAARARFQGEPTGPQQAFIATRDPNKYAVAIFGEPGSEHWGWQFSGHHGAANFTVHEGRVGFTPTFLGSSPRRVETGPFAGSMALPHKADRGLELMQALSQEQQSTAQVSEDLPDGIFEGPGRKASLEAYEGLQASELNADQRRLLRALIEEYVRNADFDAADAQLVAIEAAGWDQLWFSWRGPIAADGRFYYRVHGPRLLIEYNLVDENHDHSIVRDPSNDYGADWLGQHYEEHHPSQEEIRAGVQERMGIGGQN
ncbi:DUF3500 domain-containing protein [Wenzhouxiangella marina]|uniref:Uncharacterized protein n=1 Tax=Wenzhouxiangella marina TaxID=1579979 RepID=A0A0K0XUH8_9GAMM|nr:DUF3500 domain-containing protein [Wenzhouxiangella marina]AKS41277.1 hypothetical protein WM2015_896 [Wenzhouxiangella marina]MBB6086973.1 hypothetical protein [Wenzhouxiangella marina]